MRRFSLALLLVPTIALADEVFLAGAGSISGRIVEQTETMVKVDIGGGIMGVPMSRVERIMKGRTPLDEYDERMMVGEIYLPVPELMRYYGVKGDEGCRSGQHCKKSSHILLSANEIEGDEREQQERRGHRGALEGGPCAGRAGE